MPAVPPLDPLLHSAFSLLQGRRLAEAEAAFQSILASRPDDPLAMYGLSRALNESGKGRDALAMARQACAAAPDNAVLRHALGIMLYEQHALEEARAAFAEAVRLDPELFQSWNNLGLVLQDLGRLDEARDAFATIVRLKPEHAAAMNNLGSLLYEIGQYEEAFHWLVEAVKLAPNATGYQGNLGRVCAKLGRWELAVRHLRAALDLASDDPSLPILLRQALAGLGSKPEQMEGYRLLERAEELGSMRMSMRQCLVRNQIDDAVVIAERIVTIDPQDWEARFALRLSLPIVPASADALRDARRRYTDGLRLLREEVENDDLFRDTERLARAIDRTNFHLAYQGEDDRDPQCQYGAILRRILERIAPQHLQAIPRRGQPAGRLRIGYAGAHFRIDPAGDYFRSWITDLDPSRFEKHVLMTDDFREDALTDEIRGAATRCLRLRGSLTEMAEQVRSLELDVLIYPELGMHHRTFALGALRLAPIQCAGWGHPVTTGHEAMDYFISCAAMEPPDGQSQYSERLVMLPGIGTSYRPFSFEGASSRNTLGLPEDAHLYFYPHSAFKIHPESDDLVGEVLAEDPAGLLVTFAGANAWVDEDYLRRVHAVFARKGIGSERIIRFPMTSRTRYLKIAAACDVMLDTVYWSGGNTTLDALTVGLPLVTLPGATMRSRQSMGMLGELELRELIAVDRQSYVRIGVSLGRDRDWRESISRRIAENRHVIFEDPRPVAALGAFLSSVG